MTPERLRQLAERYDDEMIRPEHVAELLVAVDHLTVELAAARAAWEEWKASSRAGHAHASDMAAEVARLRAGIARVMVTCTDRYAADALLDLLNPTEGETDHADA